MLALLAPGFPEMPNGDIPPSAYESALREELAWMGAAVVAFALRGAWRMGRVGDPTNHVADSQCEMRARCQRCATPPPSHVGIAPREFVGQWELVRNAKIESIASIA